MNSRGRRVEARAEQRAQEKLARKQVEDQRRADKVKAKAAMQAGLDKLKKSQ